MPYIDETYFENVDLEPVCATYTDQQTKAFEKIKRLALSRERGSHELKERLTREGFSSEDVKVAIERAMDCGLVDDLRYGEVLVRTRVSQGKGRQGIESELCRNGISASSIPGWPEAFFSQADTSLYCFGGAENEPSMVESFGGANDEASEVSRALALLRCKPPRSKNVKAAAYRKLVSKGYAANVAMRAVHIYMGE